MIKKFLTFGIFAVSLIGVLIPQNVFAVQCTPAQIQAGWQTQPINKENYTCVPPNTDPNKEQGDGLAVTAAKVAANATFSILFEMIGRVLMTVSSLILIVCGQIFDAVINYTIVDVSSKLGDSQPIGTAITGAWATLRDVANMAFIFVLLFAAFKAMFNLSFSGLQTTIRNIIIAALVINFSLFLTKVVFDASNIVALGFYKSIATTNETQFTGATTAVGFSGISGGYMRLLGLQSFYGTGILEGVTDWDKILIIGVMSSIFMLLTAVIFLITAVMFVARFLIFIILAITSAVAVIMVIIPGQRKWFDKWSSALISQSFFAPVFFALTWVSFKIGSALVSIRQPGSGDLTAIVTHPSDAMTLVVNYILLMGLAIIALVVAKGMATSTAGFTAISGGVAGAAAWTGRRTVGQLGRIAERPGLQAAVGSENIFARTGARLALYGAKKAGSSTFDVRNATVPTGVARDLVQGTAGRTKVGKALGLADINIPDINVGQKLVGGALGKGGTEGFMKEKAESQKRVREREAAEMAEANLAKNRSAVNRGAKSPIGSDEYIGMEQALARLSDKETETLVASNRKLLESQNFANIISVKQLEAINKSDQFTDSEKSMLKNTRFSSITSEMRSGSALSKEAIGKIKGLHDSELEMVGADYLKDERYVSTLRPAQIDAMNKSVRFTATQKKDLSDTRMKPLKDALVANDSAKIKSEIKKTDYKTLARYMNEDGRGGTKIALDKDVLQVYTPQTLKKMAQEMNAEDIDKLRSALETGGNDKTKKWLNDPDKGGVDFS